MSSSNLKALVKEAKARMLNNDYAAIAKLNQQNLQEASVESKESKSMETIVAEIAASTVIVTNPIGRLVDEKYFDTLNEIDRERYILAMAEKYKNMLKKVNF